jgi:hypothetical protein
MLTFKVASTCPCATGAISGCLRDEFGLDLWSEALGHGNHQIVGETELDRALLAFQTFRLETASFFAYNCTAS